MIIQAVGIDAAFSNMGFAQVRIHTPADGASRSSRGCIVECTALKLVTTEVIEDRKVVRKSSTELRRAKELHAALIEQCAGNRFAFVEVPSGSQSANAARALGIAVGVLAACPIHIIEVSPMEVKELVHDSRKGKMPSKPEMIAWAMRQWPKADWVLHERNGKGFKKGEPQNCNEHLADALATVMAGIKTPEFQGLLSMSGEWGKFLPSTPRRQVLL